MAIEVSRAHAILWLDMFGIYLLNMPPCIVYFILKGFNKHLCKYCLRLKKKKSDFLLFLGTLLLENGGLNLGRKLITLPWLQCDSNRCCQPFPVLSLLEYRMHLHMSGMCSVVQQRRAGLIRVLGFHSKSTQDVRISVTLTVVSPYLQHFAARGKMYMYYRCGTAFVCTLLLSGVY